MQQVFYEASDGAGMSRDDVISWLSFFYENDPRRNLWSFDDITGGESEFRDEEAYLEIRNMFENEA